VKFEVPWKCPESGKDVRHFRLTMADLLEAARHFETPTIPELARRLSELRYEDMAWIMWLGLRHEDETLDAETVASWPYAVLPARDALMDAWCRCMHGRTTEEQETYQEKLYEEAGKCPKCGRSNVELELPPAASTAPEVTADPLGG